MLELLMKGRACPACGAGVWRAREDGTVYDAGRGGTFFKDWDETPVRAPRERSGLAHAAGFAGVFYLFRYSLAPFVFAQAGQEWMLAVALMFVWSLLAPAALALSFAAALSMGRSPRKSGKLPALFGFFVGWFGVLAWLTRLDERWLTSLINF